MFYIQLKNKVTMMNKCIACIAFFFLPILTVVKAQTVVLDYYFNHEIKKTNSGALRFHYLWDDKANTGFSIWGGIFRNMGAKLDTLDTPPTAARLKGAGIYIIVDPDNKKESDNPHYIETKDINNIVAWVKAGGILVLMANDSANVELPHFNNLAARFGLHFNDDLQNHVIDDHHFNDGIPVIVNSTVFKTTKKPFIKDACSITQGKNASTVLQSPAGAAIAAIVEYSKGTVFAAGDPWLYNEYVNGRLPATFDNDKAAADLAAWLLQLAKTKSSKK
ncbi:MAG: hypothetical protein NVSMB7_03740 [Chitinophagaceae bacterium]